MQEVMEKKLKLKPLSLMTRGERMLMLALNRGQRSAFQQPYSRDQPKVIQHCHSFNTSLESERAFAARVLASSSFCDLASNGEGQLVGSEDRTEATSSDAASSNGEGQLVLGSFGKEH